MEASQPVLIVGAGPTGLALALFLKNLEVPFRIIEKNEEISELTKALGIQPRTMEIFDRFDLMPEFLAAGRLLEAIDIYVDGKVATSISYKDLDTRFPFPLVIGQNETEEILSKRLKKLKVKVERETELLSLHQGKDSIHATLQKSNGKQEELTPSYVIGCDGAHSTVRHMCGIGFVGDEYPETFSLCDGIISSPYSPDQMHVFTTDQGPVGLFPFKEKGHVRVMVSHNSKNEPKAFLPAGLHSEQTTFMHSSLSIEDMSRYLEERGLGEIVIEKAEWLSDFRIHKRIAKKWRHGRFLLAGDAAHIHSPMGGQGMNTGIQDAWNLAWKLKFTLNGASDKLLDNYAKERRHIGKQVLNTTDNMTRMMLIKTSWLVRLRGFILKNLFSRSFFRKIGAHRLSQLFISYPASSSIQKDYFQQEGILAGMQAIDRPIGNSSIFKILDWGRFTCLMFTGLKPRPAAIHEALRLKSILSNQDIKCAIISLEGHIDPDVFQDEGGACHKLYGAGSGHLTLIRPDGYIAMQHDKLETEVIESFIKGL